MTIFGRDFTYDGVTLSSINDDYALVSIGTNDNDDVMYERAINSSNITDDNYIKHYYGHMADPVLEFDVTITRCSELPMTKADAKVLTDWLFAYSEPKVLSVEPRPGEFGAAEDIEFIGAFTSMHYEAGYSAITFHFENISAYAFTRIHTYNIDTGLSPLYTIENTGSKTGELIFPKITVNPQQSGALRITIGGLSTFSVVVTNGINFIIEDRNMYRPGGALYSFDNLNNFNWPYLTDGINVCTFGGARCNLIIETRFLVTTGF